MSWNPPIAQCEGKAAYATKRGAITVITRIQRRGRKKTQHHKEKRHSTASLQPYRCDTCHQWHVGNPSIGKVRK